MKCFIISSSFQPIHSLVKILIFTALLFTASAFAQDPVTRAIDTKEKKTTAISTGELKKWIGAYDPLARACERDVLTIQETTFSWMDCKEVRFREIVNSEHEFAFMADPNSSCGWTAKIISLTSHAPKAPLAISVRAYKDVVTFKNDTDKKYYLLYCSYTKRLNKGVSAP